MLIRQKVLEQLCHIQFSNCSRLYLQSSLTSGCKLTESTRSHACAVKFDACSVAYSATCPGQLTSPCSLSHYICPIRTTAARSPHPLSSSPTPPFLPCRQAAHHLWSSKILILPDHQLHIASGLAPYIHHAGHWALKTVHPPIFGLSPPPPPPPPNL